MGAPTSAAVTADLAIVRKPVLTLYRQRPPEVGVPSENPRLDEPGRVITDFVDRVGDPGGIVAGGGSGGRARGCGAPRRRAGARHWSPTRCVRWPTPPPAGAPCPKASR